MQKLHIEIEENMQKLYIKNKNNMQKLHILKNRGEENELEELFFKLAKVIKL